MAATWCFLVGSSRRRSFWTKGRRKARVLPLPVTACTLLMLIQLVIQREIYLDNNIFVTKKMRNRRGLNRRHLRKTHGRHSIENPFCKRRSETVPSPRIPLPLDLSGSHDSDILLQSLPVNYEIYYKIPVTARGTWRGASSIETFPEIFILSARADFIANMKCG